MTDTYHSDGLPRISRKISDESRATAIERARDGYGRVICEHCAREIRSDQQITLNHKIQWSDLRGQYAADVRFQKLPENSQRQFLRRIYNEADNLQPLHVACHREVDFGLHFTPQEEEQINRRIAGAAPAAQPASVPVLGKITKLSVDAGEQLRSLYPTYRKLLDTPELTPRLFGLLSDAPQPVFEEYMRLNEQRIEKLHERIARKEAMLPANEDESKYKSVALEGLSHQLDVLMQQAASLEFMSTGREQNGAPGQSRT